MVMFVWFECLYLFHFVRFCTLICHHLWISLELIPCLVCLRELLLQNLCKLLCFSLFKVLRIKLMICYYFCHVHRLFPSINNCLYKRFNVTNYYLRFLSVHGWRFSSWRLRSKLLPWIFCLVQNSSMYFLCVFQGIFSWSVWISSSPPGGNYTC